MMQLVENMSNILSKLNDEYRNIDDTTHMQKEQILNMIILHSDI